MKTSRPGSSTANATKENSRPAGPAEKVLSSAKPAAMQTKAAAQKNDLPSSGNAKPVEASHTRPVTTSRSVDRVQAIPADLVKEILSGANGPLTHKQLIEFSSSPVTAKDMRPIPRTWPTGLISAKNIWSWADALVDRHQHLYVTQGADAYAKSIMDTIFPDDPSQPLNLPQKLNAICVALDKEVILQCRDRGLSNKELDDVRIRVVGGFLYGRVLCLNLQPFSLRTQAIDAQRIQMDEALIGALTTEKRDRFMEAILTVNDPMLEAEPLAKPLAKPVTTPKPQAPKIDAQKMQIKKIIGNKLNQAIEETGNAKEFYQLAESYLNSTVKDKKNMMTALLILCSQFPKGGDRHDLNKWKKAEQFVYDNRHRIDKLTEEGKIYFLKKLNIIAFPDRRGSLNKELLNEALAVAEGMLSIIDEDDGSGSVSH